MLSVRIHGESEDPFVVAPLEKGGFNFSEAWSVVGGCAFHDFFVQFIHFTHEFSEAVSLRAEPIVAEVRGERELLGVPIPWPFLSAFLCLYDQKFVNGPCFCFFCPLDPFGSDFCGSTDSSVNVVVQVEFNVVEDLVGFSEGVPYFLWDSGLIEFVFWGGVQAW